MVYNAAKMTDMRYDMLQRGGVVIEFWRFQGN